MQSDAKKLAKRDVQYLNDLSWSKYYFCQPNIQPSFALVTSAKQARNWITCSVSNCSDRLLPARSEVSNLWLKSRIWLRASNKNTDLFSYICHLSASTSVYCSFPPHCLVGGSKMAHLMLKVAHTCTSWSLQLLAGHQIRKNAMQQPAATIFS